ncbi:hypothetical protein ABIA32_006631, partial [Streptacidiphilus sp. MAP12-20]
NAPRRHDVGQTATNPIFTRSGSARKGFGLLTRDYEARTDSSEAMIWWSMSMVMSRRLARRRC